MGRPDASDIRKGLLIGLVPVVVLTFVLVESCSVPVPTREEAEAEVMDLVGKREGTALTVECDEPDESGYRCRLRAGDGRYGYATTSVSTYRGEARYAPREVVRGTRYELPVDAEGLLVTELVPDAERDLGFLADATVALATSAFGTPDYLTTARCPTPPVGETVACAPQGMVTEATMRHVAEGTYELTARFRVPAGQLPVPAGGS